MRPYSSWPVRITVNLVFRFAASQARAFATAKAKMPKILCVAEKPSISKAVAGHLSGGQFQTASRSTTDPLRCRPC